MRPRDRIEGYAIQGELEHTSRGKLFGWKIAATSKAGQQHINVAGPMAGRILQETVVADGGIASMQGNEMRVAEPEFAFRMARDLPSRSSPYSVREVLDAVDTLHPAFEIPDSRFVDFVSAGEAQLIADNACAHLFVLGAPTSADWRARDLVEERPVIALGGKNSYRPRQECTRRSPRRIGLARERIARARIDAQGGRGGHDRHLSSTAAHPGRRFHRSRLRCARARVGWVQLETSQQRLGRSSNINRRTF